MIDKNDYIIVELNDLLRESAIGEVNDKSTRIKVKHDIECFFDRLKTNSQLDNYSVICDETNNKQNSYRFAVDVKFKRRSKTDSEEYRFVI